MKGSILSFSIAVAVLVLTASLVAAQHEHGSSAAKQTGPGAAKVAPGTAREIGPELLKVFDFHPFATELPDHLWMKVDDNHLQFLHFQKPVTEPNNRLVFIGDGIRGRFCAEDQPEGGKTGYVHFHSATGHQHMEGLPGEGHGGKPGEEGYWLRHIAVGEFDMMGMHFRPGVAPPNFMATTAPKCGS
jgi:hypothetical protein